MDFTNLALDVPLGVSLDSILDTRRDAAVVNVAILVFRFATMAAADGFLVGIVLATTFNLSLFLASSTFVFRRLRLSVCFLSMVMDARVDDLDDSFPLACSLPDLSNIRFLFFIFSFGEISLVWDRVLLDAGCKDLLNTERANLCSVYFFFKA